MTKTFGFTEDDEFFTIDTAGDLVFKIRKNDYGSNTQSAGDLASLIYQDEEFLDKTRGSQVNSGFDYLYNDQADTEISCVFVNEECIKVTVTAGYLTQYYIARKGVAKIYMGTIFEKEPEKQSLVRYIVRAYNALLPNSPTYSDVRGNTGAIESADIFGMQNGETRSKHYSNQRQCDWSFIGATGENVGLWMVVGNTEGMSGGPFYRCLLNQCGTYDQEITYMINYGMAQTEKYRLNVLNTYTLAFTDGSKPQSEDLSWLAELDLKGWIGSEGRGKLSGKVSSVLKPGNNYRFHIFNEQAQYWSNAILSDGNFIITDILPGEYTAILYKEELGVYDGMVAIKADKETVIADNTIIISDPSDAEYLWRISDWSGSPADLLNGDKITLMHPSDIRMSDWKPGKFVIGESLHSSEFPAYQWRGINNGLQVSFELTDEQISARTLRIGITIAFDGGRPQVNINDWTGSAKPSIQPATRSLTVGTYRGNNIMFTFKVPASAFKIGENILSISVISGKNGAKWLSPGYAFDAIDLI